MCFSLSDSTELEKTAIMKDYKINTKNCLYVLECCTKPAKYNPVRLTHGKTNVHLWEVYCTGF